MARKPKPPVFTEPVVITEPVPEAQADLVQEIDRIEATPLGHNGGPPMDEDMAKFLGGMKPEDYLDAVYQGIEDAIGDADIYTVAAAIDMTLAELLAISKNELGAAATRDIAIKYAQTILPYTAPLASVPYKRLRQP
jgi:hypothetical protein